MKFDWILFAAALILSLLGAMLIYSAVHDTTMEPLYYKQAAFLIISIGVMVIMRNIPIRIHDGLSYIYYIIMILALIVILMQGGTVKRWISFGIINIQPSELSKLFMVFVLGRWLRDHGKNIDSVFTILPAVFMVILPFFLVMKEPDLGTGIVFFVLLFVMLYSAGVRPLHLFLMLTPVIAMISALHWIAWAVYFSVLIIVLLKWKVSPATFVATVVFAISIGVTTPYVWSKMHPYQRERIIVFLNPSHDPFGSGYQLIQSKIAIGSGGLFGKGFLQGSQINLAFLPAKHSDFIFAVLAEQFGFVGCLLVLIIYWILMKRIIDIAAAARTPFGSIIGMGIAGIIFFQVFINIAMTLGFAPVTGIPLPFLSSGGSSLIVFWAMIGVMQNIHSQSVE